MNGSMMPHLFAQVNNEISAMAGDAGPICRKASIAPLPCSSAMFAESPQSVDLGLKDVDCQHRSTGRRNRASECILTHACLKTRLRRA
ncbi:unnamed protein product [Protopolystoma xenopodis]|uniref:Uncharacterized protein n=1 Tax=Protopolystoma xenopodis TaxID=117903 RepID=A0A3S5CMH8_9PLAT|nr:unnamed protein product [Protopolystoma xenopodis]